MRINYQGESLYLFDLSSKEAFLPQSRDPETGKIKRSGPIMSPEWLESFGLGVEEHKASTLLNGGSPEEIAEVLTEMSIPTGGRRRDGTLNTHWTASSVMAIMRNEKHCGDVLARKTYTPNYKDHKSKRNNGKKNKYFQADHHEAIVSRSMWNAAQRILNSRKYGHEGAYLPIFHFPLPDYYE